MKLKTPLEVGVQTVKVEDSSIIDWGAWLAMNLKLFEDKGALPLKCAAQALNILNA
jgi:hypothetical protein